MLVAQRKFNVTGFSSHFGVAVGERVLLESPRMILEAIKPPLCLLMWDLPKAIRYFILYYEPVDQSIFHFAQVLMPVPLNVVLRSPVRVVYTSGRIALFWLLPPQHFNTCEFLTGSHLITYQKLATWLVPV